MTLSILLSMLLISSKIEKLKVIAGRDLAVLKLSESITEFNEYIRPIYLVSYFHVICLGKFNSRICVQMLHLMKSRKEDEYTDVGGGGYLVMGWGLTRCKL